MDSENNPEAAERDFSYDAVHDDLPDGEDPRYASSAPAPPVTVTTQTDDDGGDYSYDLAHDIPRSDG